MKTLQKTFIGTLFTLLLSSNLVADCSFELFSISSTKDTRIIDFIEQLSDECEFTVIVTDPNAQEFLNTKLNKTHLKNLTIDEVLKIILHENNLSYTLENNLLKISYLTTKVFSIDYILSQRASETKTDVTLSSGGTAGATGATGAAGAVGMMGGTTVATSESGILIESTDEVFFWEALDQEFQSVLNRPHDMYKSDAPIINKNAGLITVTSTIKQMERFESYLKKLQDKVQLQVLIDVQLLSVTIKEGQNTGVDWSQLYKLQNLDLSADYDWSQSKGEDTSFGKNFAASTSISLQEVIKFLNTQGDVSAISNPKVLTLNNQPALISVGTEYFYKILTSSTLAGGSTGSTTQNELIQSIFAGVLLDITPEISDDKTITLKINPSISETTRDLSQTDSEGRTMPPDLDRRQLSSVVTVKDGNRIILGGLISTKTTVNGNQVPLLGNLPLLGSLFSYSENSKTIQELILVIEPHIINKEKNTVTLKDLGYKGLKDAIMDPEAHVSDKLKNVSVK